MGWSGVARGQSQAGVYRIHPNQPQQIIRGLGFEIQSDSIGSLNQGMPDAVIAVPHDLVPDERQRFYKEMLHGFRYTRLAMGLYLRGTDAAQQHIVERYPGQMDELKQMQDVSGIEGFDVEYWSPTPFWKDNKSYFGGTIAARTPEFFAAFSDALVDDVRYLQNHGLRVAQWGLQNEPVFGMAPLNGEKVAAGKRPTMPYAICFYSPEDYAATLDAVVPKLRKLNSGILIHANSWDGPSGDYAAEIRKRPALLAQLDAWTWHQVGENSDKQIDKRELYVKGAGGKPVFSNEFEYQPADLKKIESPFMNTGQSIMNWFVFENSPIWFWLHALKPTTNKEAAGYALGFWRPISSTQTDDSGLEPGHWKYNPQNWNAIAGFLKYMEWDVTRLTVDEPVVLHDQRILAWRTKSGALGLVLSNRGKVPFTFRLSGSWAKQLSGHRYTVSRLDEDLGHKSGAKLVITVPPQSFEFWCGQ